MCGIIGILGNKPVAPLLVDALKRLEYRGYDSAGIATIEAGRLSRRRAEGKLVNLESRLNSKPLAGHSGIGHTRWATHGAPNEANAHPHATETVAVVHNGIIENFQELRRLIEDAGRTLTSDTDTEVIAHLLSLEMARGLSPADAMQALLGKLEGAFAVAVLFDGEDDLMIAARRGSPLAIGQGNGECYLGSDAIALAPFTDTITYLEDGDWAVLTRQGAEIFDPDGHPVFREPSRALASTLLVDKGNHRHFMAKEIHEQPEVISHTLGHYLDFTDNKVIMPEECGLDFTGCNRLVMSACGTAYYAGLIGKYWFETLARLPVDIDIASEFRYRETPLETDGMALFISQSGETADTLASLRYCKDQGQSIVSIVNVPASTIARESDCVLPTLAGPEIGVASTKAFTCQLAVIFSLAILAGRQRGTISRSREIELVRAAIEIPRQAAACLRVEHEIEEIARDLSRARHALYLGRGTSFALAMEGALKLKEISYIHAEGYAAGELKHGPIALIDEDMPVIVLAPEDGVLEKTLSNVQEVAARGARLIVFTSRAGAKKLALDSVQTIVLPDMPPEIVPVAYAVPIQLLAYHTAVFMGTDVDQPRNLAKSVTVE